MSNGGKCITDLPVDAFGFAVGAFGEPAGRDVHSAVALFAQQRTGELVDFGAFGEPGLGEVGQRPADPVVEGAGPPAGQQVRPARRRSVRTARPGFPAPTGWLLEGFEEVLVEAVEGVAVISAWTPNSLATVAALTAERDRLDAAQKEIGRLTGLG